MLKSKMKNFCLTRFFAILGTSLFVFGGCGSKKKTLTIWVVGAGDIGVPGFRGRILNPMKTGKDVLFRGPKVVFKIDRLKSSLGLEDKNKFVLLKPVDVPNGFAMPKPCLLRIGEFSAFRWRIYKKSFIQLRRKAGGKAPFFFCSAARWDKEKEGNICCRLSDLEILPFVGGKEIRCLKAGPARADPFGPLGPLLPGRWRLLLGGVDLKFRRVKYSPDIGLGRWDGLMWGPVVDVPEGKTVLVGPLEFKPSKGAIEIEEEGPGPKGGGDSRRKYQNFIYFSRIKAMGDKPGEAWNAGISMALFKLPLTPIWKGLPPGNYVVSVGVYHPEVYPGFMRAGPLLETFFQKEVQVGKDEGTVACPVKFKEPNVEAARIVVDLEKFMKTSGKGGKERLFVRGKLHGPFVDNQPFLYFSGKKVGAGRFVIDGLMGGRYKVGIYTGRSLKPLAEKPVLLKGGEVKNIEF